MDNIENHDATQTIVSYHGGCPDGMGAMLSAYLIFGEKAQYVPVVHTEPFPDVLQASLTDLSNKVIYCLDYCPKEPYLSQMVEQAKSVIILDHHNGSHEQTEDYFNRGMLSGLIDESHSGAVIAWSYFFPEKKVPFLLQCVEDRDIWKWNIQDSDKILVAIDSYPLNLDDWLKLVVAVEENPSRFIRDGESILRYKDALVNATLKTARKVNFLGHAVLAANTHEWLASDVGNTLAEGYPFSVIYFDMDGQRKFSLRSSQENGLNVRVICELLGGGGHVHAGGCQVSFDKLNHEGMPVLS